METTTIPVSSETRQRLNIIKAIHGFASYEELLIDMINTQYDSIPARVQNDTDTTTTN